MLRYLILEQADNGIHQIAISLKTILSVLVLILFPGTLTCQIEPNKKRQHVNIDSITENFTSVQMEEYLIRKNHHSPQNRKFIMHTSREFTIVCMFDNSCIYSFADSNTQSAINKIFGYSFGSNHHYNSIRIGWRCQGDLIEVLAYWYINQKCFDNTLFFIEPGKKFFIYAKIGSEKVLIDYQIEDMKKETKEVFYNSKKKRFKRWGYVNYPYFGGTRKAPHNMVIYLKAWIS